MKNKILVLFTLLLILSSQGYSQNYTISIGSSIPTGEFGDDDLLDDDSGYAGLGLSAGLEYTYPITESGFNVYGGIGLVYNPMAKDVQDDVEDADRAEGYYFDYSFPKYVNIPISAGLKYVFNTESNIDIYGQGGLSLDVVKLTNFIIEDSSNEIEFNYTPTTTLGYNIGAGIILNDKYSIGVKYFAYGDAEIEGEVDYGTFEDDVELEKKISFVTLTIGFILK